MFISSFLDFLKRVILTDKTLLLIIETLSKGKLLLKERTCFYWIANGSVDENKGNYIFSSNKGPWGVASTSHSVKQSWQKYQILMIEI